MSRHGTFVSGVLTGQASFLGAWVAAILLARRLADRNPDA